MASRKAVIRPKRPPSAAETSLPHYSLVNSVCPVHSDKAPGQVNWAGLPVNLDFAFSRKQRDKVYVQHLLRKREAQLWRWLPGGEQACICDVAAEQAYAESLSADMR